MSKTRIFRVENGRMLFKCYQCDYKRMLTVGGGIRTKSIRCGRCGESTRCVLNRRLAERESQSGKVVLLTNDGREIPVDLFDISLRGVGFEVSIRDMNRIAVGRDVQLKCPWNAQLFSQGRYIVRSVKGQRVGVEMHN
ncbi:MAG: hypothetical protein V2B20_06750 [Pseudomonadota bacterium]